MPRISYWALACVCPPEAALPYRGSLIVPQSVFVRQRQRSRAAGLLFRLSLRLTCSADRRLFAAPAPRPSFLFRPPPL